MENALQIIDSIDTQVVAETLRKITSFQSVIQTALKEGKDFGKIPGAGDKPSLFKPGAEKINMLFGLNPEYEFLKTDEDFKNGFFNYNVKCTLYRNGQAVSQGVGSCNSMELKYRYNNVDEQKLDELGIPKENAVSFKDRYGRVKYRIVNPEPASLTNTILKMAKKRAYVDATLQVASLSDLFTQDLEDMREQFSEESTTTMTAKDAANITLSFGKYKGKTLGELYKSDLEYIKWLAENDRTDAVIKKAISLLKTAVSESQKMKTVQSEPAHTDKKPAEKNEFSKLAAEPSPFEVPPDAEDEFFSK